ncbi:hypothetical protein O181_132191 [Austropuccinia psidii MF-1]|uniref:Uncharacterized protein n=1 Tax=Austropuccinia psidii MF-1 TaxID=1389203 RepID=A0A9Q3QAZ2_9BASI|nr:hypothetical protein [Austropuccinia psidii MF-1]
MAQVGPIVVRDPPAPFGLIGLGQKGPKWPTDRESQPTGRRSRGGLKWPKKAIEAKTPLMKGVALNPRMMARGPGGPRRQNDPSGPKSKMKAWGLVKWELAKKANEGRIWPDAIRWPLGGVMAWVPWNTQGGQLAIKDMT